MISLIFYPILTILLLFFLGFGLTLIILPKNLKAYSLWLSPWFTILFLIIFLSISSNLGFSVREVSPIFISFLTLLNIIALLKTKLRHQFTLKEDLLIAIIIIVSLVFNMSPLIRRDKMMTTISMGNNDASIYAFAAEYLVHYSFLDALSNSQDSLKPAYDNIALTIKGNYRWGPPMITAFFLNLWNLKGYQFTYIFQTILFALALPLLYLFFKLIYKASVLGLILATILMAFNVNLLYIIYHDFFGQVLFWGIQLFLIFFFFAYFASCREDKVDSLKHEIIIPAGIAGLYFSYHEGAVFVLGPLIFFLFIRLFLRKNIFPFWQTLLRIALGVFLLSSSSIFGSIILDTMQAGNTKGPIGWQVFRSKLPFASPFEAMGLWSLHNFEPLPLVLSVLLSLLVIFVISFGFIKSKGKLLLACFVALDLLFVFWTVILDHNFFTYNRALTYFLPLFLALFAIGIVAFIEKHKYPKIIIISIILLLELFSGFKLNKRFNQEHISVDRSLISLKDLNDNKNIKEVIYTDQTLSGLVSIWRQVWTDYFLYTGKNIYTPGTYDFPRKDIQDNSLVLLPKVIVGYEPQRILLKDIVWENEFYKLGRICRSDKCLVSYIGDLPKIKIGENEIEDTLFLKGWHPREGESRWANAKESSLRLVTKRANYTKIAVEVVALAEPQELSLYLDGDYLGNQKIRKDWQIYNFDLNKRIKPGVHKLVFKYSNLYTPFALGINQDRRELSVNFKRIEIQ